MNTVQQLCSKEIILLKYDERKTGKMVTDLLTTQPVVSDVGLVVLDGNVVAHTQHTEQVKEAVVLSHKHVTINYTQRQNIHIIVDDGKHEV